MVVVTLAVGRLVVRRVAVRAMVVDTLAVRATSAVQPLRAAEASPTDR